MWSRSPWLRRVALAVALAGLFGYLPYHLYGRSGLARLVKLRGEVRELRTGNGRIFVANEALRAELSLYDDDELAAIERIARDELGMVRPGELVFRIEATPGSPPSATTGSPPTSQPEQPRR